MGEPGQLPRVAGRWLRQWNLFFPWSELKSALSSSCAHPSDCASAAAVRVACLLVMLYQHQRTAFFEWQVQQ